MKSVKQEQKMITFEIYLKDEKYDTLLKKSFYKPKNNFPNFMSKSQKRKLMALPL